MSFKKYLRDFSLNEETNASDIATVDNKLINQKDKHLVKGKKCKEHKRLNCQICGKDKWK